MSQQQKGNKYGKKPSPDPYEKHEMQEYYNDVNEDKPAQKNIKAIHKSIQKEEKEKQKQRIKEQQQKQKEREKAQKRQQSQTKQKKK